MDLAIVGIAFVLVFPAELPDKTALASLVLGARYRALHVFVGVAAAFAVHVVLAITAGSLLALLPKRPLQAVVAVLFLLGAVLLLRGRHEPEDEHVELKGRLRVIPLKIVIMLAAAAMAVLAVISLIRAIRG